MARTKKQTLENASERKRLIQEEILRESLAAKQKAAAAAGAVSPLTVTKQPSATGSSQSRSKGKHRLRKAQSSPDGVASQSSPPPAPSDKPASGKAIGWPSTSKRRKGETCKESSKSNDSLHITKGQVPSSRDLELKTSAATVASHMPKDIYSSPSNSPESNCDNRQGMERAPEPAQGVLETNNSTIATSPKTQSPGSRKGKPGSVDQGKQKKKRSPKDHVNDSLMSLKAASEMVREEKRRTSRQRSPGASKEESPGSQNPSPERRSSPRNHSPSNSADHVDLQQHPITGKKKAKRKIHLEERPKVNIFTDNIGVELGKRIRSPRRLSEDMIALPIFSARRWNSSSREASYIAEKTDGEGSPTTKLSVEDQEPFKSPHAVSQNSPFVKGSKRKSSFNDNSDCDSVIASDDRCKEYDTPLSKKNSQKVKGKKIPLTSEDGDDGELIVKKRNKKKKHKAKLESCSNKSNSSEDITGQLILDVKKEPSEYAKPFSEGENNNLGQLIDGNVKDEVITEKNDHKEDECQFDKHVPDGPDIFVTKTSLKDEMTTDLRHSGKSKKVASEPTLKANIEYAEKAASDGNHISKNTSQSPEKTFMLKTDDVRKKEESVQKSPKKSKAKPLIRTSSGERKKKQREKMKIGEEVLTSICRDIMSGVVITPSESLESKAPSKSDPVFSKESDHNENKSRDFPTSQNPSTNALTTCASSGLFSQALINSGVSIQKERGASSSSGLLQPAKNILMSPLPGYSAHSATVVTSATAAIVIPSTCVQAVSSSVASPTITSRCSLPVRSIPAAVSFSCAKPILSHQSKEVQSLSLDDSLLETSACPAGDSNSAESVHSLTAFKTETTGEIISDDGISKHSIDPHEKETSLDLSEPLQLSMEEKIEKDILSTDIQICRISEVTTIGEEKAIDNDETQLNNEAPETNVPDELNSISGSKDVLHCTPKLSSYVEPNTPLNARNGQAETAKYSSPVSETAEASSSYSAQEISKESPQSSLLCAMLVGGSEVADTYEKSKPTVGGAALSLDTDNKNLNIPPTPIASMCEEKPEKVQSLVELNDLCRSNEEPAAAKAEEHTLDAKCEMLSEKGDARPVEKSVAETAENIDSKTKSLIQNRKESTKKDLKIDILSKLRGLDETVLKLMEIDVEETFLDSKYLKSEPSFGNDTHPDKSVDIMMNKEKETNAADIKMEEKALETPLYGVISNLATRLKGKTLVVDVDEVLDSCPKHMLKICSQVDEEARGSTLKLRLEKEVEERKEYTPVKNNPVEEGKLSLPSSSSTENGSNQNQLSAHISKESGVTQSTSDNKGEISPQTTNSSSDNSSLCELDPDAMTSAVNDACMDVSIDCSMKSVKDEPEEQDSAQDPTICEESSIRFLVQKSKTLEFSNPLPQDHLPAPLRRVSSSPQLKVEKQESPCENMSSESLLNSSSMSKSKLGSKIPVAGYSGTCKSSRKTWRTPRIILEPKPLAVLSELEESSDSTKNIFTCPNLQKYLSVPSNRVIVPPHKKKEMQILDERAKKDGEEREANMAERSDKERQEEMINLEYLKYEPDFDEVDGLLFMSFSCEAELTAHARVERALAWDKDDTMLRIAQAKAFEEAKHLKAGMEAVKFKHLRGQHMRWKKYRRLYSSEVKSILNGAPSSVEEHLRREAVSKASSRKTSDITKIKNWKSKAGSARQNLEKQRQKAREYRLARKEKLWKKEQAKSIPSPYPTHSPYIPPSGPSAVGVSQCHYQLRTEQTNTKSNQLSPQLNKSELDTGADLNTPFSTRSKGRSGFSHQKEHKQLFKELNMDWEDRMIHRKLGGWSLKGNRPKAFSQAAHRREEKHKMLLSEEGSSTMLPVVDLSQQNPIEILSPESSNTPSRVSSSVDIWSPSKEDVESQKKKKSLKLIYPLLTERMARNALTAMINLRKRRRKNDDVDGNSNRRKSNHKLRSDELPALQPILPHPDRSIGGSQVMWCTPPRAQLVSPASNVVSATGSPAISVSPASNVVSATGSPAISDLCKFDSTAATPLSSLSMTANVTSSVLSSPTPLLSQLSSAATTPSTVAGTDTREDAIVLEGVDTVADMVSSPSIADRASSKSCGKPGCRYGCICHLCLSASSTSPVGKSLASTCDKEYCRLGCICDSLDPEKPIPEASHCRQPSCMLGCTCSSMTRSHRESASGMKNLPLKIPDGMNKRKAKLKYRSSDHNDGHDCDNIPYLPSMKRKPPNERFSNLPQREKTHRSAKNLDAITRKALMLYETSEIYCEKTERLSRKDQKDLALCMSGAALDEDFSFIDSTMVKPVVELDSPPEEDNVMPFETKKSKLDPESSARYAAFCTDDQVHPVYSDTIDLSEGEEDRPSAVNMKFEDYLAKRHKTMLLQERQTLPILQQSAHKRKRKSHPLSDEIFTLSTCARTQPYDYKRKQKAANIAQIAPDSTTSNLKKFTPILPYSHTRSGTDQSSVAAQANSTASCSGVNSSLLQIPPAPPQAPGQESSAATLKNVQETSICTPTSNHNRVITGSTEAVHRTRFQQPWHTSMVCLKARGPPPKRKQVSSGTAVGGDDEEDVQEEDEVKLLEFLANCNWEGARKEILGKVAQCLTRGQYPQPRTMKICEFLVEILPKAHRPSVIPEELRKKLPGKMYSIRVRVTRREVLPRAPSDADATVIDLSDSSPVKTQVGAVSIPSSVPLFQTNLFTASKVSSLSANVGISGLSRMCVTSKNELNSSQQKSSSAPNSRRSSTDVNTAAVTEPSATDHDIPSSTTQLQKKSSLMQSNLNMVSASSSQASIEKGKTAGHTSVLLTSSSDSMVTCNATANSTTSITSAVSTLPYPLPTKPSQVQSNTNPRLPGTINTQPRSPLTNKAISSVDTPTSNILPFYYTVKPDDLKYMKIQGKDGLMQVVGVSSDNKALVTVPVSGGQRSTAGDQPKAGPVKLPFITVPVCGPHGRKIIPIIPTSPSMTSSSLSGNRQPILLKIPTTQAHPQGVVKGPVLLRPMGSQPQTGKPQPVVIPSSCRSLLRTNNPPASKEKSSPQLKGASTSQSQSITQTAVSDNKPQLAQSNTEIIIPLDTAHLKQSKDSTKISTEISQQSFSGAENQGKVGHPPATLVTHSLLSPIMSSEESPTTKSDQRDQNQASSISGENVTESDLQQDADPQDCDKIMQQEDTAQSQALCGNSKETEKRLKPILVPSSESKQKVPKGPNLYVSNTNPETSTIVMVYPPSNALIKTSKITTLPVAALTEPKNAGPSMLGTPSVTHSGIVSSSSNSIIRETPENVSAASSALLKVSLCSSSSANLALDGNSASCAATSQQPTSACEESVPSLSTSQSLSASLQTLTESHEINKQGVKRKLPSGEDREASTSPTSFKKGLHAYPDTHRQLPIMIEEPGSTRSSIDVGMGLNLAGPSMLTASSASNERPISSLSTSLSTASSDNLLIMLSSDESDIDVGEIENPSSIIALRENAERAFENDHGYLRAASSGSTSPVPVQDKAIKAINTTIGNALKYKRKDFDAVEHNKRERIRRLVLKDLFLDLQKIVCQVTGAGYDPNLSRAKILDQAKSVILELVERERDGQQRYKHELEKKSMLLKQREILYNELSKTMPTETVKGIADQAVRKCKERRVALAIKASKLYKTLQDTFPNNRQEQSDEADAKPVCENADNKFKEQPETNLAKDLNLDGSLRLLQAISQQSLREIQERKVGQPISSLDFQSLEDNANPDSNPAQAEVVDTVDLISSSSSAGGDQGSVEAYQGSPSPARYEDISEPEEATTIPAPEAQRSRKSLEASAPESVAQEAPQSVQCYEDISDVEESKLPNYEDISDSEEAVVLS